MARGVCSLSYNLRHSMLDGQVAALWESALQAAGDSMALLTPLPCLVLKQCASEGCPCHAMRGLMETPAGSLGRGFQWMVLCAFCTLLFRGTNWRTPPNELEIEASLRGSNFLFPCGTSETFNTSRFFLAFNRNNQSDVWLPTSSSIKV